MPREAGKATATHRAYAAYLTETTGQKISHNTVQTVLGNLNDFRQSEHYVDLKSAQADAKAERDAAKVAEKKAALQARIDALGGNTAPVPTKAAPAKRAPRKAAAPAAPRGNLKAVEDAPPVDDDEFDQDDDF